VALAVAAVAGGWAGCRRCDLFWSDILGVGASGSGIHVCCRYNRVSLFYLIFLLQTWENQAFLPLVPTLFSSLRAGMTKLRFDVPGQQALLNAYSVCLEFFLLRGFEPCACLMLVVFFFSFFTLLKLPA
jgi:hypothetical protein